MTNYQFNNQKETSASQAKGRGFESHLPLPKNKTLIIISIYPSKHDKERSNQNF